MSLRYVDTSAAIKLLREETHSKAFAAFYDSDPTSSWVTSTLLRIELMRTVNRVSPTLVPDARELLLVFDFIAMDDEIVDLAAQEPGKTLRSLDAIHLATARVLGPELDNFVTYDDRLADAVSGAGFEVISPRD